MKTLLFLAAAYARSVWLRLRGAVRSALGERCTCDRHHCHARRCNAHIRPVQLMCLRHWRMLPGGLQRRVLEAYRPGQERDKAPSEEWLDAASAAIAHVDRIERGVHP